MSPPKSLEDLLREFDSFQISSPKDRAAVNAAIEANKWARKVRHFLTAKLFLQLTMLLSWLSSRRPPYSRRKKPYTLSIFIRDCL